MGELVKALRERLTQAEYALDAMRQADAKRKRSVDESRAVSEMKLVIAERREALALAVAADATFAESLAKAQEFKRYVHGRLDAAGVPVDPEGPHKDEGCRVGGRLDIVLACYTNAHDAS